MSSGTRNRRVTIDLSYFTRKKCFARVTQEMIEQFHMKHVDLGYMVWYAGYWQITQCKVSVLRAMLPETTVFANHNDGPLFPE